jgi:hypothetical protein
MVERNPQHAPDAQSDDERRQKPKRSSEIKGAQSDRSALFLLFPKNRSDEVTTQDEEHGQPNSASEFQDRYVRVTDRDE